MPAVDSKVSWLTLKFGVCNAGLRKSGSERGEPQNLNVYVSVRKTVTLDGFYGVWRV